jgi:hypothetical protein
MTTKRVPLSRRRVAEFSDSVFDAFAAMLKMQCTCERGRCARCDAYSDLNVTLARDLGLRPWETFAIQEPGRRLRHWQPEDPAAQERWRALEAALKERERCSARSR